MAPICQAKAAIQLEVASARSKVRQAEHHLAACMAKECPILGWLYGFQAELATKQLDTTEEGISTLRDTIHQNGFQIATWTPRPSVKLSSQSYAVMTKLK